MRTLKGWRKDIRKELPYVDIKPYSHNIISIGLRAVAKKFGEKEANKIIEELKLERLGWKPVK